MQEEKNGRTVLYLGLLITLLATAVRLINLGGDSLWFDEVLTTLTAREGWAAALNLRDHPPLLYWLVTAAIRTFGAADWVWRLPSMLAGIAAVPLLVTLGVVSKRPSAGLWAALFLALSPFHLRYSQEARHYALLMCFSLLSTLLLYLALSRRQARWWLLFAVASALNLYTHYGAFMVLAAHLVTIVGWLVGAGKWRRVWQPVAAGGLLLLLYAPWLPRLLTALDSNLGETAVASTGITPLTQWLRNACLAFGLNNGLLALLILLLACLGIVNLVQKKEWLLVGLLLSLLTIPFVLITVLQVARWSFPKYIIYMLPAYLLLAGVGLEMLRQRLLTVNPRIHQWGTAVIATAFILLAAPTVRAEYAYVERDWRGAVSHLAEVASDGDIFVVANLDLPDGFNQGGITAPFYLDRTFAHYTILDGNRLNYEQLQSLPTEAAVWILALDRHPPFPQANEGLTVHQFSGSLFLIHPTNPAAPAIAQLQTLFTGLQPVTIAPSPRCMLKQGVAALHFADGDNEPAAATLNDAQALCPTPPTDPQLWQTLESDIQYALLDDYLQAGEQAKAQQIAQAILQTDSKDSAALAALTVKNLLTAFEAGEAIVTENGAPEPMRKLTFTMPQNGDWGEVLLVHPPAAVSYSLTLPQEPTALSFRFALAPESWAWGGDGSTFVVQIQPEGAATTELFRQHIDNSPENQRWHEATVPLVEYAGQTVTLTLTTEAGAAGDSTGDWAGWETPRLIWQP